MAGIHTSSSSRSNKSKKYINDSPRAVSSSSPSSSLSTATTGSSDSEITKERHKRHHRRHNQKDERSSSSSRRKGKDGLRIGKSRENREKMDDGDRKGKRKTRDNKRRSGKREHKKRQRQDYSDDNSEPDQIDPKAVVKEMLQAYPSMASDLHQLLQMLDDGQAVDIRGMSERSLTKYLKKLFVSLNLKENETGVFLLPSTTSLTLEVVGQIISSYIDPKEKALDDPVSVSMKDIHADSPKVDGRQVIDDSSLEMPYSKDNTSAPRRRTIGPEMPSAELLAAAAKLTEAEAELRESQLGEDNELFIGPPPPVVVSEAASTNEAERFEEVTRIMGIEAGGSPYDVLAVNGNMSDDNVKKRYWKLSLMVHPDKCSHPQAHQAFIILNKAFKEFQDPDKRKVLDEKIKLKEQEQAFKAELQAMREAAHWRRLQGISMEGDDELLAENNMRTAPKRDEWMTALPPERKPGGMPTQTTMFSKSSKEGRGNTSSWTDTPSDKAQKAKMNYLEAYNEATALASHEEEKKRTSSDADLVDQYNKIKRSKSLLQKQQEEAASHSKRKSKKNSKKEEWVEKSKKNPDKEEWVGQHPWKPWDREKDLTAGRQNVKLDSENMSEGLTSRFSSGNFQRNFL